MDVVDCGVVHGHQAAARAGFNRHVAQGHAAFHGEAADGFATEFDGVARSARRADLADDIQRDVFGGYARFQTA